MTQNRFSTKPSRVFLRLGTRIPRDVPVMPAAKDRGRVSRLARITRPLLLAAMAGCNQPPEIIQVGDYRIADSFSDFLQEDVEDSPSFEITAGDTLAFRIVATDPEGGPIRYAAGPLPMGATFDEHKGTFAWTPGLDEETTGDWFELYLVAMDEQGAWDAVVVDVVVYPPEGPVVPEVPRATFGAADTVGEEDPLVFGRPVWEREGE